MRAMIIYRFLRLSAIALIAVFCLMPSNARADMCLECHSEWEDGEQAPSKLYSLDVHNEVGLGCADCHGGNPALDDMDDVRNSKGYRGVPEAGEIPLFCARCHSDPAYMVKHNPSLATDQLDKYKTSVHGKQLLGKGDTKTANCVSSIRSMPSHRCLETRRTTRRDTRG